MGAFSVQGQTRSCSLRNPLSSWKARQSASLRLVTLAGSVLDGAGMDVFRRESARTESDLARGCRAWIMSKSETAAKRAAGGVEGCQPLPRSSPLQPSPL